MKKILIVIAALLMVGLLVWGIGPLLPSNEKQIRRLFAALTETLSIQRNESPLIRLAKINKLLSFFSSDAVISLEGADIDVRQITGRDELRQVTIASQATIQQLQLRMVDIKIKVHPDKTSATAQMAAMVDVNNEKNSLVEAVKILLHKIEGDWQITRVETIPVLK